MDSKYNYLCILIMALVTYSIRMLSPVLLRKKIKNRFLKSFIYYAPYVTLSVLTVPAIFYSTENTLAAVCGFVTSLVAAWLTSSLPWTAIAGCLTVFIVSFF